MANKYKMVEFEFAGEPRQLRFDMNALAELETLEGKSFNAMLGTEEAIQNNAGIRFLRNAIYCGLMHNKLYALPLKTVGEQMDAEKVAEYTTKVMKAIGLAFGISDEKIKEAAKEQLELPPSPGAQDSPLASKQ